MHKPNNIPTFAEQKQKTNDGAIAQLVEQRTENPCVPGSIPGGTTEKEEVEISTSSFFLHLATSDFIPAGFRGTERSRDCS